MNINWKDHIPSRKQSVGERIGISKNGSISFLTGFYKAKKIDIYKYVLIRYDKNSKIIGFYFTNNNSLPGKLTLYHLPYSARTQSTSFWRDSGFDLKAAIGKYTPKVDRTDGKETYYIELK